jgi:lipooligosaccharide transport system permease protein
VLVLRVVEANFRALGNSWRADALAALAQPIVLLVVFAGLLARAGAGGRPSDWAGGAVFSYGQYVAIGIACSSGVLGGATEASHLVYTGLRFDDRFTTIVTTPVSPMVLGLGHLMWAALHGACLSGVLFLLTTPFLPSGTLLELPVAVLVSAVTAASVAAPLSVLVSLYFRTPQILNIIGRVILPPLLLFSATYFPVHVLPRWAGVVVALFPVSHANIAIRAIYVHDWQQVLPHLLVIGCWLVAGAAVMVTTLRRQLSA